MIAACPKCNARYRIDVERLRPEGARLRCARCEAVFRVRPPAAAQAPEAPVPPAAVAQPAQPAAEKPAPEWNQPAEERDRTRLILVADPGVESGKSTAGTLASWGLEPILVHDGVEAILSIQRTLPRVVVIDAALPKMFGFQVCELMKRNESLRHISVVLVGAIHDNARYRRSPSEIYGADAYIERPQLPDALRPILHGFGLPVADRRSDAIGSPPPPGSDPAQGGTPEVAASAAAPVAPAAAPVAPPPPAMDPPTPAFEQPVEPPPPAAEPVAAPAPSVAPTAAAADDEVARAERLARIVVSDIILYNQEKFDAAVNAGNVLEAMQDELHEGRALLSGRIAESVRELRDFVGEELERVARSRSAQ